MLSQRSTLRIRGSSVSQDEILLISATGWLTERGDSGYQEIESRQALQMLDGLGHRFLLEAREFVAWASVGRYALSQMDEKELRKAIRQAIIDGRILAIQKGEAKPKSVSAAVDLRRLVAQIEKETRGGLLAFAGRQYKLVVGDDLERTPRRDSYQVVDQDEARTVLDGTAKESSTSGDLLREASGRLSKDWRPPFSEPDGLVLLRRIPVEASTPRRETEAMTPSQLAKLMVDESSTLEVQVFGLDDKPLDGLSYVIEAPDGETYEADLGSSGKTKITSAKKGSAGVTLKWSDAGSSN